MSTGDFLNFIFKWAVTGQPQTFAGIITFFNVSLLGTGDMGEMSIRVCNFSLL